MRGGSLDIAVIGAGAAGLVTSWLLEEEHRVTLYEQESRLGGHIHTLDVDTGGGRAVVEAGFEFFWEKRFPTFLRLLELLGVPVRPFPARVSLYRPGGAPTVLPPLEQGWPLWPACRPRTLLNMVGFVRAVLAARPLVGARDPTRSVGEFLDGLSLPASIRDEFLFPLLLAGWCVEPEQFREFQASDVLSYFPVPDLRKGLQAIHLEVEGGGRVYVDAIAGQLRRARVLRGAPVAGVVSGPGRLEVGTADGGTQLYDAVVLATNASQAAALLSGMESAAPAAAQLSRIVYSTTKIAVHGDRSFMPDDRRLWSTVNIRYDGRHAHATMWKPWRGSAEVFRSWVTFEPALPQPLYELVAWQHPRVDRTYVDVQRRLPELQGRGGIWLAGMYTNGVDWHESAVQSALDVARRLSPGSSRLAALTGASELVRA